MQYQKFEYQKYNNSKFYRYREKYIDMARKLDMILTAADIVLNPVRFDKRESIIVLNVIEYQLLYKKLLYNIIYLI